MIETTLFWILAPATVACAVLVIVLRNAVGSAIFLIITFLLSAGIYILLEAPFIAAIQVLVYAGAIMVLFLFVIMLLNLEKEPKAAGRFQLNKTVGVLLGIILLAQLGIVFLSLLTPVQPQTGVPASVQVKMGATESIARLLFTDYLLPFEIASLLLLAAIVGSVILAKREV
jgi:NADH-quinone oxidoreductase subunit J